jgi:hypothetical protein
MPEFKIKREDSMDVRSKVLSLTPEDRKRLGINKSTLWYMRKYVREGKRIKVYGKVMGKIMLLMRIFDDILKFCKFCLDWFIRRFNIKVKSLNLELQDKNIKPAQFINSAWYSHDVHNNITAGFGVLEISTWIGQISKCKAEVRYRIGVFDIQTKTFVKSDKYIDGGYANWYDVAKRDNISDIRNFKNFKLGKYLQNTTEDIHQNEIKYLQLFYILKEHHTVTVRKREGSNEISGKLLGNIFLCTNTNQMVGKVLDSTPFNIDIEVAITGKDYPKKIWAFNVTITSYDQFIFKEI